MSRIRSRLVHRKAKTQHHKILRAKIIHHHHRRYAGIRTRPKAQGRRKPTLRVRRSTVRRKAPVRKKLSTPSGMGLAPLSLASYMSMI